ncbi:MAG: rRNA maturation RNase YbeY [Firmicutes bacterium]|jgi:probable rRNA maturation factor|nr:rRNA maturation RNase YbeY [Bacillota bacterium]MDH7495022.1 rRNA maturation RNase YbeY [Bacillota bacterium]
MPIEIINLQDKIDVTEALTVALERAVVAGMTREGLDPSNFEVSVALVDDERIRELNRDYRAKDCPTDVLSFAMDDQDVPEGEAVLGDIVISLQTAARESAEMGGFTRCVVFLAVHGLLHLLGYDHASDEEAEDMEEREREIMAGLGLPSNEAPPAASPKGSDAR